MSEAKLLELYRSWDALVKHKEKMGRTLLELIAHPDATQEQIAEAVPSYRLIVAQLREHKPTIINALNKDRSWRINNCLNAVRNTHI